MDAAHRHIGDEKCSTRCQSCISELSVNRALWGDRQLKLTHYCCRWNRHYDSLCRLSVLHKYNMILANWLYGMYFCSLWSSILPNSITILCHLCHTILMCHQYVSILHQDSITYLTTLQLVLISPSHLSILHNEHSALLTLSRIEEIVTRQTLIHLLLCR